MTPEEIINKQTWEILQNIKEESLAPEEDGTLFYDTTRTVIAAGENSPTRERKWAIIRKLAREKAIEITKEIAPDWTGGRNGFYLKLLQPKFDEVYEKYRRVCDLTSHLNDYQERMLKGDDNLPELYHIDVKEQVKQAPPIKHRGKMFETGGGGGYYNRNYPVNPPKKLSANEIVDGFSSSNYTFVQMVVKGILSASEFGTDGEVNYRLQSAPGQMLMQERQLLSKFEKLGLFRNLGEDGIFGIATLSDVDTSLIKQIIAEIEERESGVISEDKFEEIKKKYDQTVQDLRKSNQSSELQERYNKILGEIRSNPKNLNVPLQENNQTPTYPSDDLTTDHNDGNQINSTQSAFVSGKLNKRDIKKIISTAKKTCNLGKKEKSLLTILSDLEPHKTIDLTSQVPTKAYKKLKESLQKKIEHLGLHINTIKGSGLNPTSYYQLKYLPKVTT